MDSNLIFYDIDRFLDKYTRFMTKNIYINTNIYNRFFEQYEYLYNLLDRNRFLYNDNIKYKNILNIKKNKDKLIRLHNQKYLKTTINDCNCFFGDDLERKLDSRTKKIILCEEENLVVVQSKNIESLISGKIKFLIERYKYKENKILVLSENIEYKDIILKEFSKNNIEVEVKTIKDYGLSLLYHNEQILDDDKKYVIFSDYFVNELFGNKDKFQKVYNAFSKYIYLNKDYKDYETFKDYHNYMYKRKYLSSKLTLKKFNEQEINKKKLYLRSIKNEVMKSKEEVDIANFLYLNSISYQYDYNNSSFLCFLNNKKDNIKYFSFKKPLEEDEYFNDKSICLYYSYKDKKSYLEVLAYELIKRRYPLELVDENVLYNTLKNVAIDNYFSEFIRKNLIPTMDYYEKNQTLEDTRLTKEQQDIMLSFYNFYENKQKEYGYIKNKDLFSRIENDIIEKKYSYLFLVGDIKLNLDISTFNIVFDYDEIELLKQNIKLLYDYKKYLYANQLIPISQVYLNKEELNKLTISFLKENLEGINDFFSKNKKVIDIKYYDDKNRLHIYNNISKCSEKILEDNNDDVLLAFNSLKDINLLVSSSLQKEDKNTLVTKNKRKILCEEILNISKLYKVIIIPYLVIDSYHEDFLKKDYDYYIKVMLYVALSKCRDKIIVLCPESRKKELKQILKKVVITE